MTILSAHPEPAEPLAAVVDPSSLASRGAATTIQSARRATRLLVAVAMNGGLSARDAAAQFSLSLPTAYHLLNSLAVEGILTKEGSRYVLGPMAGIVADGIRRGARGPERYIATMRELAESTGETTYLSAWKEGEVRILEVVEGSHVMRVSGLVVGYSQNLHARTSARLLLAFADPQVQERRLDGLKLRRLTRATITSRSELNRDLERIRRDRVSVGRDEYVVGLTCASVPILENDGVVAAVTLAVPSSRFQENGSKLVAALRLAAADASGDKPVRATPGRNTLTQSVPG
ncbi:hypothetical protein CcI49_18415 [Frankia sp. CcI49]|uniref:IclR family transcriptional regulator n=1 Tax=unclassified Frankia TaxID=2632575 RepID=UPI0009CA792A|nr:MULTISPECIES: IclR family transcriptional regulator C-terminal domain-containing protein [unclassified Frankia]ONH59118.1 hypothetical protein CcI49_18415 [Frankia sp. CcI49]